MRNILSIVVVLLALCLLPLGASAQAPDRDDIAKPARPEQVKDKDKDKKNDKDNDKDKDKNNDKARQHPAAKIVKGPVIESVGPTSAVVAWSTNVNSSTVLRYGTTPGALNERAQRPWGGLTHRVELKNLKPNTTYYFDVESEHAQGTGTEAESGRESFHTPPKGGKAEHNPKPGPGF